jgi:chloramphenicol 3-O-phosphotransferase
MNQTSSTRLVLLCGLPASGKTALARRLDRGQSMIVEWGHWARVERARRRNASGEWSASPMTRAHFEQWATIFQAPDDEELLLFDEPGYNP